AAFNDARYISFPDAPAPLELTGGPSVVDASGGRLPGVSRWAASLGGEYSQPVQAFSRSLTAYFGVDASYRSEFSSSPTPSRFLNVDGYTLLNLRAGLRAPNGVEIFGWVRNVTQTEYFDFLSAAPGGSGLFVGQVGDPRTFGLTLRGAF
ncbi:MAG: TonB-dependent receptor, partial [Hyphomonadaceae bacterium]|nr:TonB-dependent receptor [Hyphomonadaceae bacterium]